jgi:hypothetical protein
MKKMARLMRWLRISLYILLAFFILAEATNYHAEVVKRAFRPAPAQVVIPANPVNAAENLPCSDSWNKPSLDYSEIQNVDHFVISEAKKDCFTQWVIVPRRWTTGWTFIAVDQNDTNWRVSFQYFNQQGVLKTIGPFGPKDRPCIQEPMNQFRLKGTLGRGIRFFAGFSGFPETCSMIIK